MAAPASAIRAGAAYIELSLRDNSLTKGMKAVDAKLKSFGSAVAGVGAQLAGWGALITAPLLGAAKLFADSGSALYDMAKRTGMSIEALSALGYAAAQTGSDLETMEAAIRRMQKAVVAAELGNETLEVTFRSLGLTLEEIDRLSPDKQFEAIARAIARIPDPTARAAAAMIIFGKSGTHVLPVAEAFDSLTAEAKDFGLVSSTESATAAKHLGDAMTTLSRATSSLTKAFGAALAPVLTETTLWMARAAQYAKGWVKENQDLVVAAFKLGRTLAIVGAALVAVGGLIAGLGAAFGFLASVIGAVATGVGLVGTVLAAVLSPLGLVVAGLVALTGWFLTSTEAGQQALAWLGEAFGSLYADAFDALKGIADALRGGDIGLAARILWGVLKVEWLKGIAFLQQQWADWGVGFVNGFRENAYALAGIMVDVSAAIQKVWAEMTSELTGSWGSMAAAMLKGLAPVIGIIEKLTGKSLADLIDSATGTDPTARQSALAGEKARIEADRQAQRAALTDQQAAEFGARQQGADAGLQATLDELAQAQEDLQAYQSQARDVARVAGKGGPAGAPAFELPTADEIASGLASAAAKVDVSGTFAGADLAGIGAGKSIQDKQLEESKKQTKQLEKLNDKAQTDRLVFGD